jgi:hypothetical protein
MHASVPATGDHNMTRWLRARSRLPLRLGIARVAVAALALATFAFAGHLHENDPAKGHAPEQVCGLCLHFERLGTTPESVLLPAVLPVATVVAVDPAQPHPAAQSPAAYRSRAPPA